MADALDRDVQKCVAFGERVLADHGGDHLEAAGTLFYSAVLLLVAKHGHGFARHVLKSLVDEDPFGLLPAERPN